MIHLPLAKALGGLVSFFSVEYVLFLPIVLLIYGILPQKARRWFLLGASYLFFWLISGGLLAYLMASTAVIYLTGRWIGKQQRLRDQALSQAERGEKKEIKLRSQKIQRRGVAAAILINIGILVCLKYSGFFAENLNSIFHAMHLTNRVPIPQFALPIGISFYTMQAVSYVVDVYRGVIPADQNLGRLALYMSFFPQIVEGPICRYGQTAQQLWNAPAITYDNLKAGSFRFLYGLMKKLVIADRLNPLVKEVFGNYGDYDGGIMVLAAVCYTIQLYCDFSGSMDAVVGTAQILGIDMPENFKHPFFSKSISEFWQRWHITLGTWFKDYIFYPVSMAKSMKTLTSNARKKLGNHFGPLVAGSISLFCVWLANGLWHGAAWNYVFFGMYHFFWILLANLTMPWTSACLKAIHIDRNSKGYQWFRVLRTSALVCIGELFFRASGLRAGLAMFGKILHSFSLQSFRNGTVLELGLDWQDFAIILVTVGIIFIVSLCEERGESVAQRLGKHKAPLRWAVAYSLITYIIVFGAYGQGYIPVDPMYANF